MAIVHKLSPGGLVFKVDKLSDLMKMSNIILIEVNLKKLKSIYIAYRVKEKKNLQQNIILKLIR